MKISKLERTLVNKVINLQSIPVGAYNFRVNGEPVDRNSTENVTVQTKSSKSGIKVYVKNGTKNESIYVPVIISKSGYIEKVYNEFYVGEDCDVLIVAGCSIDNCGNRDSEHDGIHKFILGKNSKVKYVEKHYGSGEGMGKRILSTKTFVYLKNGSSMEIETEQIGGISNSNRTTNAFLQEDAKLVVHERLFTHNEQNVSSFYKATLSGENSRTNIVTRSIAKGNSCQKFKVRLQGNSKCIGHIECDSIIMDGARVSSVPSLEANCVEASLTHEAAIGKIANEQLTKLMTLGLNEKEAEKEIIRGFLN